MEKKVCIGVIGAGYWGPNLIRNFYNISWCHVKYVCDLDDKKLNKLGSAYPETIRTREINEVLNDKEVVAVVIATPVFTHYQLAKLALEKGKHVLLEKPMTTSVVEGEELVSLSKKNNLILMVDHTFLYTGAVRKIKELISAGSLGKIYYFDSERINLGLIQPDINVIWDLAPHDIAIMNYLFSGAEPISVLATGAKYVNTKVDEMAHITVKFDSGFIGHIHVSWLSPVKIRKILVGGSEKMVYYNDLEPSEKIKVYDKGIKIDYNSVTPMSPLYRSGDVFIPKLDESEALLCEAKHFIACVVGTEHPLTSGTSGLDVIRILECCDISLKENREIIL